MVWVGFENPWGVWEEKGRDFREERWGGAMVKKKKWVSGFRCLWAGLGWTHLPDWARQRRAAGGGHLSVDAQWRGRPAVRLAQTFTGLRSFRLVRFWSVCAGCGDFAVSAPCLPATRCTTVLVQSNERIPGDRWMVGEARSRWRSWFLVFSQPEWCSCGELRFGALSCPARISGSPAE
jgi:hypothetical protein